MDMLLDKGYYHQQQSANICLDYCFKNDFKQTMTKIVEDMDRRQNQACMRNCLNKMYLSSEIMKDTLVNHPRTVGMRGEFTELADMVKQKNNEDKESIFKEFNF